MRVFCLALVGVLGATNSPVVAQEAPVESGSGLDRAGAFELVTEPSVENDRARREDSQIFSPLSPVIVEPEPVKLPQDQTLER